MTVKLSSIYDRLILDNPIAVIFSFLCIVAVSLFYSFDLELDASGESLILENDTSLNYYRQISQKYASDDFIVIAFRPTKELLSEQSINTIRALRDELLELSNIESVSSILDVPIIYESGLKLSEITDELLSLDSADIDYDVAYKEFKSNPLYKELIVSKDGATTALQALFKRDAEYDALLNRRQQLQTSIHALSNTEIIELEDIRQKIRIKNKSLSKTREQDIKLIREIIARQKDQGELYLGGIPMITVDMIQFIKHDLVVFGSGVFIFLVLILSLFFHKVRWVLLPMLICAITGLSSIGFMGFSGWAITVISSNFLSILLIITLSLTIHLIVRYRDLQLSYPASTHKELIKLTTASMARPCFYTILTTAVAFASLVVSEIRPVIDFGWIMVIGLAIAFIVSFTVMPACLTLLGGTDAPSQNDRTKAITLNLAKIVHRNPAFIIITSLVLMISIGYGISMLEVENRFINNFKSDTEIFQGMKLIDSELGGTMPLDIIIDPDKSFIEMRDSLAAETNELDALFFDEEGELTEPNYWLNPTMLNKAKSLHEYLESHSVIGKVISIVTSLSIVEKLNGAPFNEFELALVRKRIPDQLLTIS